MSNKRLNIYVAGSHYSYDFLFNAYTVHIDEKNNLVVHQIDPVSGEAMPVAAFRLWDYYRIEEN